MTHAAHHPDDEAVDRFAAELKAKLADARAKGRGGWEDKAQVSAQALSDMLLAHVFKGDPRDVANFAMFLHQRGESIALADGPRMEHAVEVFQIAEQRCAEHHAGAGRRTQGVSDHIRKELAEIAEAPDDLEEWIDVVILALDGAWRTGASPEQIIATLKAKQAKNEARTWPDWRTADPNKAIEHSKETAP